MCGSSEEPVLGLKTEALDLLSLIDDIHDDTQRYELFKDTFLEILDLEDAHFSALEHTAEGGDVSERETVKRSRSFAVKQRGGRFAEITEFSDGTLVLATILAVLVWQKRDGALLCIEEIENSLHPRAIAKLVEFLREHSARWPVLMTTHSPSLLNVVSPEEVRVAVVDQDGAAGFKLLTNQRAIGKILNAGYASFGDLLTSNFDDVLQKGKTS